MVVEASNKSNVHKVFIFVKNESISSMLDNDTINNPVLMSAFEFVKKISMLERHYLIS